MDYYRKVDWLYTHVYRLHLVSQRWCQAIIQHFLVKNRQEAATERWDNPDLVDIDFFVPWQLHVNYLMNKAARNILTQSAGHPPLDVCRHKNITPVTHLFSTTVDVCFYEQN